MKALFVTDLHGSRWKYERLFEAAQSFKADVVINGGDMLPKERDLFRQGEFITNYLDNHLARFHSAGIYYLCYLGNDDLMIFDRLFEKTCAKYAFVVSLAQRKYEIGGYEFVGMNWVADYPFGSKIGAEKTPMTTCLRNNSELVFYLHRRDGMNSMIGFPMLMRCQHWRMN